MIKYLVTLEYRYNEKPNSLGGTYRSKIDTIGVFDEIEKAIINGNNILIELEKHFKLNQNYNRKSRLSEDKKLITNLGYLITPFDFFLKI